MKRISHDYLQSKGFVLDASNAYDLKIETIGILTIHTKGRLPVLEDDEGDICAIANNYMTINKLRHIIHIIDSTSKPLCYKVLWLSTSLAILIRKDEK